MQRRRAEGAPTAASRPTDTGRRKRSTNSRLRRQTPLRVDTNAESSDAQCFQVVIATPRTVAERCGACGIEPQPRARPAGACASRRRIPRGASGRETSAMQRDEERRYEHLSPFELKNRLVELAKHRGERMMLNAGRGNPNWLALTPRAALFLLGEFALGESQRVALAFDFGGLPPKRGIAARLDAFLDAHGDAPGSALLRQGVAHACSRFGFDADLLVAEWVDGVLGDHYPLPVRMLPHAETLVRAHLVGELFGGDAEAGRFDYFAVEGASAGIAYLLPSLVASRLLAPGDRIALGA